MRRIMAFSLLVCTLALAKPRAAHACSCVWPGPAPDESFAWADAVFMGTVSHDGLYSALDRRLEPWQRRLGLPLSPMSYSSYSVLSVHQSWKGIASSPIQIQHDNSNCDYAFRAGERYLIYAVADAAGLLYTSMCSGTGEITYMEADLIFLETQPTIFVSRPGQDALTAGLALCAAFTAILVGSVFFLRYRHHRRAAHQSREVWH